MPYFLPVQIPEWLAPLAVGTVLGVVLTWFANLMLQKRQEKLKVILDLEIKPRTLSDFGAWAVVSNLSAVPVWLEGFTLVAEELGSRGKGLTFDAGRTIKPGEDERIECHEQIFEAFQTTGHGGDLYVGHLEIAARVRSNGGSATKRRVYSLTSSRHSVQNVMNAPGRFVRLLSRIKTYARLRFRRWLGKQH